MNRPTDPARWERIEAICFEAMSRTGRDRVRYLDEHCTDDPELRETVERLLGAADRHPDFLSESAVVLDLAGLGEEEPDEVLIGPYRVVRPLGSGGMGDVLLAAREGDGFETMFALKVIRRGLDTDRVLERFREERRILAQLHHPNIAALVDGGATDDGRPWFAMEYVDGEPIDAWCGRAELDVRGRIELIRTVCAAVHHAHQNLVLHRDIKPQNILVTQDGTVKLLDFGIAKVLDPESSLDPELTAVEERPMTPGFAAPEQLDGRPVTTATDVFGLGVLLYRVLTGESPYDPDARTREEARASRRTDPPRPSRAGGPGVGRELDAVVLKALAENPDERYSSPLALSDDLGRVLEGRPLVARAPTIGYTVGRFVARHRAAVAAAALALVAATSMGVYTWRQSLRVATERDRALEVRSFLLESFGAAGADRTVGDSVTARALLDGQAATVMEGYADDPALLAEMTLVLAEGYERLGLLAEADVWAGRAVDASREARGGVASAASLVMSGWVAHQLGRSEEAAGVLRQAVDRARAGGEDGRALPRALNDLGVVQESLGDYGAAEAAHREAMELRARQYGANHRSVAVSASNLSAIHYRAGDLDAAVREAQRALAILRTDLGPDHQRSIIVQSNLAVFKLVQGDLEGAEEDYRDLWARQARLQGEAHPVTVRVMMSLATVLRRAGDLTEAAEVLEAALAAQANTDATNALDLAFTRATLGDVRSAEGRHQEGVSLLTEALDAQTAALGREHVDVAQTMSYLSSAYERVDSLDVAVDWQRRVVDALTAALGDEHAQTVAERERLETLRAGT